MLRRGGVDGLEGIGKDLLGDVMKERGIIFSGPMTRAILEGRKTMTRRIIKPQPPCSLSRLPDGHWAYTECDREWKCPYGVPGDRLWMRETWRESWTSGGPSHGYKTCVEYRATWNGQRDPENRIINVPAMRYGGDIKKNGNLAWHPSIYMPRWASRITLEIESVEVERVQEITEVDAAKEGMPHHYNTPELGCQAIIEFQKLWESLNPGSWERNDYCWVIGFRRMP